MPQPLVTVICLCYNHALFVKEALESVFNQTYRNLQVIVVDDASTDGSKVIIDNIIKNKANIKFLKLLTNQGNCAAFNEALKLAEGDYIIDFATDDVMMPEKIERQINFFTSLDKDYGVVFTNAIYIDANGKYLRNHFEYLLNKKLIKEIPEGDIYQNILKIYFIPSPTMMIKREVLTKLNGYDATLSYEDFDFWVRSSRYYKYAYLNESLMKIRRKTKSMSTGWYVVGDDQLHSTYLVCRKALSLNRCEQDHSAWAHRVKYELRQSVFSENHMEAKLFYALLKEKKALNFFDKVLFTINEFHLPLGGLRNLYHKIRFQPLT